MRTTFTRGRLRWIPIAIFGLAGFISQGAYAQTIPTLPTTHPRILLVGAEKMRLQAELSANTPAATRFRNIVNNAVAGSPIYGYSAWYSAMMGVLTGQPQYCTDAVNRVETYVASEEARIAANTRPVLSGDSYLEVGDYVGDIMLTYDWCHANLSESQKTRWRALSSRAIANVWDPDNATWNGNAFPWSGWSINNPVNNYHYSFLRATMLYGMATQHEASDANTWLNHFRNVKIGSQLVPTFNSDLVGGGSREGTGYGTAMKNLFGLYHLWEKTTGERLADLTPHSNATMYYMLHMLAPTKDRIAPIGDHARDETAAFYDYHREMLMALSSIYTGTPIARRVRSTLATSSRTQMGDSFNFIWDFMYPGSSAGVGEALNTTYLPTGTGHLSMRSGWGSDATWLMFLNGPYTESHAHADGLSILLFKNGWLVNDANMQAHSGIFQDSSAHAMVTQTIAGQAARMYERPTATATRRRLNVGNHYSYVAADHGTLYTHPSTGNPGVRSERELVFIKPNTVVVFDRVNYTAGSSLKNFQLPTENLPTVNGRVVTVSNGGSTLKVHALAPANSALGITPLPSVDADFRSGYRIDSSVTNSTLTQFLNVLSIDNSVTSATTGANANTVVMSMEDGRQISIAFDPTAIGGTIEMRDAYGAVIVSEALPSGIAAPGLTQGSPTLTVAKKGNGSGTVTSNPAGMNCGATCSASFAFETSVTLTATPQSGSVFVGWRGGYCSGTGVCTVAADDAKRITAEFLDASTPRNLVKVTSRKTHGAAGAFDLPVDHAIPIGGSVSVEPRSGAHLIVFEFDGDVGLPGTASVRNAANAPVGNATTSVAGREVRVALTGMTDATRVTVTLTGVNGSAVNHTASLAFLAGDTNSSRVVDSADLPNVRMASGAQVAPQNFWMDINGSGRITAADISAIKRRSGRNAP